MAADLICKKILEYWKFKYQVKEELFLKRFSFEKFDAKIKNAMVELDDIYHRKIYLENIHHIVRIQSRFRMYRIYKVFSGVVKRIIKIKKLM